MAGDPVSWGVNAAYVCEVTALLVRAGLVSVTVPLSGGRHRSRVTQHL